MKVIIYNENDEMRMICRRTVATRFDSVNRVPQEYAWYARNFITAVTSGSIARVWHLRIIWKLA